MSEREITTQEGVEARARALEIARVHHGQAMGGMCDDAGVSASAVTSDSSMVGISIAAILRQRAKEQSAGQSLGM